MRPAPAVRVAVTGVGAVSTWGWGSEFLWQGLLSGKTGIAACRRFSDDDFRTHVSAEVPAAPAGLAGRFRGWSRLCQAERFAVASAAEALSQARLGPTLRKLGAAVIFGSSTGGMFETEEYYARLRAAPDTRPPLSLLAAQQVSAPGDAVARQFEATGPVYTISSACTSGTLAIGQAYQLVREGEVRLAIAGAADGLCRITYGGFNSLRSVDERPCRPFRKDRAGLTLGEGGAVVILERLDDATRRGVAPLAEIVGFGSSNDAHHMTAPHPEGQGAAQALRLAFEGSGLTPESIDFINAHGTGTRHNDAAEFEALSKVFGRRARQIPVTCAKCSVGHLLGAAGALEAVATVLCLRHEKVHPTAADGEIDPATPVNLVEGRAVSISPMRAGLSLNLGFGGSNAVLLLAHREGSGR